MVLAQLTTEAKKYQVFCMYVAAYMYHDGLVKAMSEKTGEVFLRSWDMSIMGVKKNEKEFVEIENFTLIIPKDLKLNISGCLGTDGKELFADLDLFELGWAVTPEQAEYSLCQEEAEESFVLLSFRKNSDKFYKISIEEWRSGCFFFEKETLFFEKGENIVGCFYGSKFWKRNKRKIEMYRQYLNSPFDDLKTVESFDL